MARSLSARLGELNNAQLVELYNQVSDREVSKFSDHTTAVKRTQMALEARGLDFSVADSGTVAPATGPTREGDDRKITVVADGNPKGSKSEARFALYRDGMTVGEYVLAVKALGRTRRVAIRDIMWDAEHEYIKLG